MKKLHYGLWLSYIDTMTAFGAIFLILFLLMFTRAKNIDEKSERLLNSWNLSKLEFEKLKAQPEIDTILGGIKLTLAEQILFKINSADVSDTGIVLINQLSEILIKFIKNNYQYKDAFRITIGGHTDISGSDEINFPLSYRRAYNVSTIIKNKFSTKGLQSENIVPIGYGSKYLKKDIPNPLDYRHRRITIVIQLLSNELLRNSN